MNSAFRDSTPTELVAQLNAFCDRFEAAWKTGQRAQLTDFLGDTAEPLRSYLRRELILLDVDYRRRHGDQPTHADYQHLFGAAAAESQSIFRAAGLLEAETVDNVVESKAQGATVTYHGPPPTNPAWPTIPGYEILAELGRGGMGVVYKARHLQLKRLVALKLMRAVNLASPKDLKLFRAEAEAVARLKHPHIVQIHDMGEHEGRPYFSQEYVEGGTLAQQLAGNPQPPRRAAELAETLARAMHVAHQANIVHRDLKPGNILMSVDSSQLSVGNEKSALTTDHRQLATVPKIADFGLAKLLDAQDQSMTDAIMGTPPYMSPEQAAGKVTQIGPLSDVYALGAILYEMLTGRPPFKGESIPDTLDQVCTQEPVPVTQLQPKVPRDLETICLKCLAKSPGERFYRSALELAEDLRRFNEGRPVLARPVGKSERFVRWCRRNPMVASLSASVVAVLLIGTGVAWYLALDAMEEKTRADGNAAKSDKNADEAKKNLIAANIHAAEADRRRKETEVQREEATAWALRVQFEHYFTKIEERPDLAFVGMASLLPKAGLRNDQSLADGVRLHVSACSRLVQLVGNTDHQHLPVALSSDFKFVVTREGHWVRLREAGQASLSVHSLGITGGRLGPRR